MGKHVNGRSPAQRKHKRKPAADTKEKRRAEWEVNQAMISSAFLEIILNEKRFPTYSELAEKLKLSRKTIQRHFEEEEMFQEQQKKLKALSDKALMTLAGKAIKGESHNWMRLFFEVATGLGSKKSIDLTTNGEPIQHSTVIKTSDGTIITI